MKKNMVLFLFSGESILLVCKLGDLWRAVTFSENSADPRILTEDVQKKLCDSHITTNEKNILDIGTLIRKSDTLEETFSIFLIRKWSGNFIPPQGCLSNVFSLANLPPFGNMSQETSQLLSLVRQNRMFNVTMRIHRDGSVSMQNVDTQPMAA